MRILSKDSRFTTQSEVKSIFKEQETSNETANTMAYTIKNFCNESIKSVDKVLEIENRLKSFGLFPLEITQIIDLRPRSLLDLQIIIEEMEERYEIEALESILQLINE